MKFIGIVLFAIGAIIGGIIESYVGLGDLIIKISNIIACDNLSTIQSINACNNAKFFYQLVGTIMLPLVFGVSFLIGLKKYLE